VGEEGEGHRHSTRSPPPAGDGSFGDTEGFTFGRDELVLVLVAGRESPPLPPLAPIDTEPPPDEAGAAIAGRLIGSTDSWVFGLRGRISFSRRSRSFMSSIVWRIVSTSPFARV
jgi:hypothetical protein